jgi:hypothetical protein
MNNTGSPKIRRDVRIRMVSATESPRSRVVTDDFIWDLERMQRLRRFPKIPKIATTVIPRPTTINSNKRLYSSSFSVTADDSFVKRVRQLFANIPSKHLKY